MKNLNKILALMVVVLLGWSCEKEYLDTVPNSSTSTETIFETTKNAQLAVNGLAKIMTSQHLGSQGMNGEGTIKYMFGEYPGENFCRAMTGWSPILNNEWITNYSTMYTYYPWFYYYMIIGNANEIIFKIDAAQGPQTEKDFIKAQALTFRAYAYTMLVQLYCYRWVDSDNGTKVSLNNGLVKRTEENMGEKDLPLSSSGEIYGLIYKDLENAIALFKSSGMDRGKDEVWMPNTNVAYATWARAALARNDYSTAAEKAELAMAGYPLMSNAEYQAGFYAPNQEWIWGSFGGTEENLYYYSYQAYVGYDAGASVVRNYPCSINKELWEKIPDTDIRKDMFLDPEAPENYNSFGDIVNEDIIKKYKTKYPTITAAHYLAAYNQFKVGVAATPGVGYTNHFRSAEMMLIIAEASYFLNDEVAAQNAMKQLTQPRDPNYDCTSTGEELLEEIKTYRSIELFLEGFDWFDKKRWNEKLERKSFADGGNFHAAMAVDRDIDHGNRWTYVTPIIETQYNNALTATTEK